MLFDLQGKRKRFVQVIYAGLAVLMGGGLIFLGIGGDAQGGLADALGIGGNNVSQDSQFDEDIDDANETLASDPTNEEALLALTRAEFLFARENDSVDETTGVRSITDESIDNYTNSVDAWERFLDTKPQNTGSEDVVDVASLASQAYLVTLGALPDDEDIENFLTTRQIVADARPSYTYFRDLAEAAYFAGDDKLGAQAEEDALKEAADSTQRQELKAVSKGAQQAREALLKARKQESKNQGGGQLGGEEGGTGALGTGTDSLLPQTPSPVPTP